MPHTLTKCGGYVLTMKRKNFNLKGILTILTFIIFLSGSFAQLSGPYTIGGTTPDYIDISSAVSDITTNGVSGPVVFNIRDGVYNQQASIGLITGTSSVNTVTFQSESGDSTAVIWTFTPTVGNNYTCRLNGCDYVIIAQITMRAIGATYARVIDIENGSTNNTVSNCIIEGSSTTSTGNNLAVIYEGTGTNSNNTIYNNEVFDGSYGIYYDGGSGISFENNTFAAQYYRAIHAYNLPSVNIVSNNISSNTGNSSYYAIYLGYCDNSIRILENRISVNTGYYGIYMYYCDGTSVNRGLTGNNFVHIGGSSGTGYGIYVYCTNYQNFYYNSVNITRSGTGNIAFHQDNSLNSDNLRVQNNIFANSGGGYAIYIDDLSSLNISDYNNLYSTGTNIGNWGGANCTTLSSWQTTSSKDPRFIPMLCFK